MSNERGDAAGYLGWFFLGAALGAAAALLLTPKTGPQARELLREQGGDVARRAQEFATEAQGRAGEGLDKSREPFEGQAQGVMRDFQPGTDELRGRARHRLAGRKQRDEGDAARPAAVLRPVGLLPGESDPRAPVPRAEAPARGAARRALTPPGRRAREIRGARLEVRRGGEALQRREEGHREGGDDARGRAGPAPEPRPLLRLRRGVLTNRDRDRVGVHPVHVAADVLVLARPRRARRPAHRERLPAAPRAALPAPRRPALTPC